MVGFDHLHPYWSRSGRASSGDSCIRPLSASTSWHQQYCLRLVSACGMDPEVGQFLDDLSFSLCSTLCPCISFRQEQFWVNILRMRSGPIPQLGAMPNLWICLHSFSPLCCVFMLMSSLLVLGPFESLASGTF